jgi:hypothetical protein
MPTIDVLGWILTLLTVAMIAFVVYDAYNPNNRVRRSIENSPAIKTLRNLVQGIFEKCSVILYSLLATYLTVMCLDWYFDESDWYPREREIEVFFKAHQWIEGEIQTCYSSHEVGRKDPNAEIKVIYCSSEQRESHVLRVKFWGPIKDDKDRVWKCERSPTATTCRLQ